MCLILVNYYLEVIVFIWFGEVIGFLVGMVVIGDVKSCRVRMFVVRVVEKFMIRIFYV